MLILSNQEIFSAGYHRDTYIHPDNPELVLKIVRQSNPASRSGIISKTKDQHRNPNQMEYEMWQDLVKNGFDKSGYFSEVKGWVDTDLGKALCVERLMSDSDFPPLILKTLRGEKAIGLDPEIKSFIMNSLRELFDYVIENGIYSFAWRLENLAVYKQNGELKLKSFDSKQFTYREWLPISKHVKFVRQMKIKRRTNVLLAHIKRALYGTA